MKEVTLGKIIGQLFEEGIRIAGELEKEMAKQVEAEKQKATAEAKAEPQQASQFDSYNPLQKYVSMNLVFQGYTVHKGLLPTIIEVLKDNNPVAQLQFGENNQVVISSPAGDVYHAQAEATMNIERIKSELLLSLQTNRSNGVIMESALELTDAFVAENVAKEDAQAFDKLTDIVKLILAPVQGVH